MAPCVAIPLLDRLIASTLVPLDAKLSAIESCRRQLAQTHSFSRVHRDLDARLAELAAALKIRAPHAHASSK
jgi:hypothetical protein